MRAPSAPPPGPAGLLVRRRLALLAAPLVLFCASCSVTPVAKPAATVTTTAVAPESTQAPDCAAPASSLPAGVTRVYIALRNGVDGSGQSAADARDGSTARAFDTILRCYAEGCASPAVPATDNLVVCLGPGTFQTMGSYDAFLDVPHLTANGFTVNKGWKIHGQGKDHTTVQLSAFLPITDAANPFGLPVGTGINQVFGTATSATSGIEISDLTIDANYPALKQEANASGIIALNLEAILLWSSGGNNWLHDLNVINAAAEVGQLDISHEGMIVGIINPVAGSAPADSSGNLIENLTLSQPGGGSCTAIAIGNAQAEVRNNRVTGYQIGYGGWLLGPASFHNNVASQVTYGLNIDSLVNQGVRIQNNNFAPAHGFGMVIGGGSTYQGFVISGNTIQLSDADSTGLLFQGDVSGAAVTGNTITGGLPGALGIRNFSNGPGAGVNGGNIYQANRIDARLGVVFQAPSLLSLNCVFGNTDEQGNPRADLPDNSATPCIP